MNGLFMTCFGNQPFFFWFNKVAVSAFICKLRPVVATNLPIRVVIRQKPLALVIFSLLV